MGEQIDAVATINHTRVMVEDARVGKAFMLDVSDTGKLFYDGIEKEKDAYSLVASCNVVKNTW